MSLKGVEASNSFRSTSSRRGVKMRFRTRRPPGSIKRGGGTPNLSRKINSP